MVARPSATVQPVRHRLGVGGMPAARTTLLIGIESIPRGAGWSKDPPGPWRTRDVIDQPCRADPEGTGSDDWLFYPRNRLKIAWIDNFEIFESEPIVLGYFARRRSLQRVDIVDP